MGLPLQYLPASAQIFCPLEDTMKWLARVDQTYPDGLRCREGKVAVWRRSCVEEDAKAPCR